MSIISLKRVLFRRIILPKRWSYDKTNKKSKHKELNIFNDGAFSLNFYTKRQKIEVFFVSMTINSRNSN